VRRHIIRVKRFDGVEMTKGSSIDATIALTLIGLLMISLIGTNVGYLNITDTAVSGYFPVRGLLVNYFSGFEPETMEIFYETSWWAHVLLVYIFANILPYSKHFHVFMSVPNVFLSRLGPLTKIDNLEEITKEVKMMLNPDTAFTNPPEGETTPPGRFGVKDVNDASWKNYLDALTCTECGRCTSVCPANITGKKLSPRKIFIDFRKRMNEVGPGLVKNGASFTDNKSLIGDYVTAEELWACTTCNACTNDCPVNIDQVSIIMELRRFLVLEESAAPSSLNSMFTNIENNGAPWPYNQMDRLNWKNE
jgi:ferredoxin